MPRPLIAREAFEVKEPSVLCRVIPGKRIEPVLLSLRAVTIIRFAAHMIVFVV